MGGAGAAAALTGALRRGDADRAREVLATLLPAGPSDAAGTV
jgi:hypothetical protein